MQKIFLSVLIFAGITNTGCKKDIEPEGTASLTIINAVAGSAPLVTNFSNEPLQWYKSARQLTYGTFSANLNMFAPVDGITPVNLYTYPDTAAHQQPLFSLQLNLQRYSIYTLFLVGQPGDTDTLFTTDVPAYHSPTDSTTGIRFVNLSPDSDPMSINIKGQTPGSETGSLSFKSITPFKNYPAGKAINSYIFEFRDAATGTLMSTYTLGNFNSASGSPRFRNVTIALKGLKGGAGASALGTLLINN